MSTTLDFHSDKGYFKSLIEFSAGETQFEPSLIEKDYFCSVILHSLSQQLSNSLVFKGGTLLAKVHAGFYRLSEDLDFSISISPFATRKQRSKAVEPIKTLINTIPKKISPIKIITELKGSNESRQYNAVLNYDSCLGQKTGTILIEIGLREELLIEHEMQKINTLLLDPFLRQPIVNPFYFPCLSKEEAYGEKVRAALTKDRLAIRDFYDLHYAIKHKIINFRDHKFIVLVKKKLNGNKCIEFSEITIKELKRKVDTELAPTLRNREIDDFDLNLIIKKLTEILDNCL